MDTANNLEIKHLTKRYKGFTLSDVGFSVPKGSIVGFIGENGAGKTTTIKLILNMIHKDDGEIKLFGKDHNMDVKESKVRLGVVMDETFFHDTLRPSEISRILNKIYPNWDEGAYRGYLDRFGLPDKAVKELSKGMKTKLSIAAALSHHPQMLILDEATSGLDPVVRQEILDVFQDFVQDENRSVMISSHITSDLEKIADYIVFIHQGKVVMSENKDHLLQDYGILKCGNSEFGRLDEAEILGYRKNAFGYAALVRGRDRIKRKYPNYVVDRVSLEDIMMLYAGRDAV